MTNRSLSSPPEAAQCREAFERMPDLLDGRLAPPAARELEDHAAHCALCHGRLAVERELFAAIRRPHKVQQAPLAAWGRFEAAIAATRVTAATPAPTAVPARAAAADSARTEAQASHAARLPGRRPSLRLALALQAAAIAVLSVALLWILVARTSGEPSAAYRTVSVPDASIALAANSWRMVFDGALDPAEIGPLLAQHGLQIVAGPSREHIYTVTPTSDAAPRIDALHADPRVRLLEPLGDHGSAP